MKTFFNLSQIALACLCLSAWSCGQTVININPQVASGLQTTLNPSSIAVGQTTTAGAIALVGGTPNVDQTGACNNTALGVWTSSNPAVATVDFGTGVVHGVAVGTATISCTIISPPNQIPPATPLTTSVAATITVVSAPQITNPDSVNCTAPCALSLGTNGVGYSFTLRASGGVAPYTWSISAGALPGWASLNASTGVISGTAATGTTNFTVKATDSGAQFTTLAVTLVVNASSACGPPNYTCLSTSTANPGTITPLFVSSAPTTTTCTGNCQNSTAFDTTINPTGIACYTRGSDGTTFPSGKSVANLTVAGGDNIAGSSVDEDFISSVASGGSTWIFHIDTTQNCPQVINTGLPAVNTGGGEFDFSRVDDHTYYKLASSDLTLHQVVFNSTATATVSDTTIFDFRNCPGLPNPFVPTWNTYLAVSGDDNTFMTSMSNVGGQGTGIWSVVWNRTKGCTTAKMDTGTVYCDVGWGGGCPGGSTPLGNFPSTGCWGAGTTGNHGIHGAQGTLDGQYYWIDGGGAVAQWTGGACANTGAVVFSVWTPGTLVDTFCDGRTNISTGNCVGHPSHGFHTHLSSTFNGPNIRNSATVTSPTVFSGPTIAHDSHGSFYSFGGVDARYWMQASDLITTSLTSPCAPTSAVYCPPYQMNVLFMWDTQATYPPQAPVPMVGHTYSCGDPGTAYQHCTSGGDHQFGAQESIGYVSQKGHFFVFASTMLGTLGNDDLGFPRSDFFIVRLGKL